MVLERAFLISVALSSLGSGAHATFVSPGDILAGGAEQVVRVDPATGQETVISSGGLLSGGSFFGVVATAIEPSGSVLALVDSGSVVRVEPATGNQTLVSSGGQLDWPNDLAVEAVLMELVASPVFVSRASEELQ